MVLTNRLSVVLILLPFMIAASVGQSHGATIRAASVAYEDVRVAVAAAASGDIVVVPAGSATWLSTLKITKRIWLVGAGVGQTIIASGVASRDCIISYVPADAASTSFFRLSGFTLDSNNTSRLVEIVRTDTTTPTYVRIDHNRFIGATTSFPAVLMVWGVVYGVVDNNTLDNQAHIDNYGLQATAWKKLTYRPGTADNLYYEDNTLNLTQTADSGGKGGRYAKRYNDLQPRPWLPAAASFPCSTRTATAPLAAGQSLDDGRRDLRQQARIRESAGTSSTIEAERRWCSSISRPAPRNSVGRGSQTSVSDAISSPVDGSRRHPAAAKLRILLEQPVRGRRDVLMRAEEGVDVDGHIAENVSWWNQNDNFDGRTGIGCGTARSEAGEVLAGRRLLGF